MASETLPKYLADRVADFAGRQWVLDKVADWVSDCDAPRVLLITGEPGCGKTALAAWLAASNDASPTGPLRDVRSAWTARHFCMAEERRGSVQPARFAQSLAQQIGERIPEFGPLVLEFVAPTVRGEVHAGVNWGTVIGTQIQNLIINSPDPEEVYDRSIRQPLERLFKNRSDARIFILVDALDEALTTGAPCTIVDLLAGSQDFPPDVRFLLTSRPEPKVLEKFRRAQPLSLSDPASSAAVNGDVRAYIEQRGVPGLSPVNIAALVAVAEGNFLYIEWLLDEVAKGLRKVDDLATLPAGLHALYRGSLDRLTRDSGPDAWPKRFQPLVGRLSVAAAQVPLELLGEWTKQQAEVAANLERVYQFVEPVRDGPSYRLYHRSMSDFLALQVYDSKGVKYPNPYHTPPRLQHQAIADFYWPAANSTKPWAGWDAYAWHYLPIHLAGAAQGRPTNEGHSLVQRLVRLMTDDEFQADYRLHVKDLAALQADLDRTLRAAAADLDPTALQLIPKTAFALVDFRRRELRPESLFAAARQGEVDSAAGRLDLFEADERWRQAALLALAWLAAGVNATKARRVLDRLPPEPNETLTRLELHVEAAMGGPAVGSVPLHQPVPPHSLANELVKRVEGQGANLNLLGHYGHTLALQDTEGLTKTGYLAEEDGPVLVSFAAANPTDGDGYFDRYLTTLEGYSYNEYRNQSLWFLLAEAVKHPNPNWVKAMTVRMATTALSPAGADFREGMWITALALQAAAGQPDPRRMVDDYAHATYSMAEDLGRSPDSSRYSDRYGSLKRRLVAFAQCFARLLNQPNDARRFMDSALAIADVGFAGFQMPACLVVAEGYQVSVPGAAQLADRALAFAGTGAHNVQDSTFCARSTARYNAIRRNWWNGALGGDLAGVVRRLAEDASTPEFAALHIVGERYDGRRGGGLPHPEYRGHATSWRALSDLYHRPLADFLRLNQEFSPQTDKPLDFGSVVHVPDRGLATLIACRLSAAVLSDAALSQLEQVALIQALVPVAAANPTTLDTVLARLLLAAHPTDPRLLAALLDLADKARSVGADSTSYPYRGIFQGGASG
jgi:hypothetical protein